MLLVRNSKRLGLDTPIETNLILQQYLAKT